MTPGTRVRKALTYGVAFAAVLALLAFAAASVISLRHQDKVDLALCRTTVDSRRADRVQWLTLRDLILLQTEDEEARKEFRELIAGVLEPIPPLVCVDNKPVPKEG